jgi:ribosomal protein S18 acetylase RimI-like enzyme
MSIRSIHSQNPLSAHSPTHSIRPATVADEAILWQMLYYAAHMDEDGATSLEAAKENPFLAQYVNSWGKPGDLGVVAEASPASTAIGAAWLRLLLADKTSASYYDDETPELAIAVLPAWIGRGVGSTLMEQLVQAARGRYPAIVLTVRADNPAVRLYDRFGFTVIDEIVNRVGTKSYKMLLKLEGRT